MSAQVRSGPHESLGRRLHRFFAYYEPSQIEVIDQWKINWAGHEALLMGELVRFHGPEPPLSFHVPPDSLVVSERQKVLHACESLLKNFFLFYAPCRLLEVDKTLALWKGQEKELRERLQLQASQRDEIIRFFADRHPQRMGDVPAMLAAWLGAEGDLIMHLRKHGSAPSRLPPVGIIVDQPQVTALRSHLRDRLRLFYSVYKPAKIGDVDSIVATFRGRENELLRSLRAKYLGVAEAEADVQVKHAEEMALMVQLAERWMPNRIMEVEAAIQPLAEHGTVAEMLRAMLAVPL
jgi:hypothetical protein